MLLTILSPHIFSAPHMLRSQGMGSMWWQSDLPRHLDMGDKGGLYNNATHITTPNATLYGFSLARLESNLYPNFTNARVGIKEVDEMCGGGMCTFQYIFAILFPCATGIMEGANLSGDLKDPARSIPKGTLYALATALVTYVVLVLSMGAAFDRETLQINMTLMQDGSIWTPYIVIVGIIVSAISSALGSLFGGSRVLQALAKDDIFPCLGYFAKGTAKGDEPRRAVVMTWFIAQVRYGWVGGWVVIDADVSGRVGVWLR